MTIYAYDSLGAAIDIIDDSPTIIGITFDGKDIQEGDHVLKHTQLSRMGNCIRTKDCLLFEEDIHDYIETLEKEELIEILSDISNKELIRASGMEEVVSTWK